MNPVRTPGRPAAPDRQPAALPRWIASSFFGVLIVVVVVWSLQQPELPPFILPLRSGELDVSRVTATVRTDGGLVWLTLTGWSRPAVIADLEKAGLGPFPDGSGPGPVPGLPLNVVGGYVGPGRLDSLVARRYILAVMSVETIASPQENHQRYQDR